MDPLDAPTYQLMGNGYAQVGQFETAINYYQKAIDINPVDALTKHHLAECYNNYGVALRNRGEWDAAIDAYRNALLLMPTLGIARTNLGDVFTRKANAHTEAGELDEAVNAYLELQKLHPNEMQIRNLLGELYLKKGDYAEALSAFQHIYNADPSTLSMRYIISSPPITIMPEVSAIRKSTPQRSNCFRKHSNSRRLT